VAIGPGSRGDDERRLRTEPAKAIRGLLPIAFRPKRPHLRHRILRPAAPHARRAADVDVRTRTAIANLGDQRFAVMDGMKAARELLLADAVADLEELRRGRASSQKRQIRPQRVLNAAVAIERRDDRAHGHQAIETASRASEPGGELLAWHA
jgi:hypothetical protein